MLTKRRLRGRPNSLSRRGGRKRINQPYFALSSPPTRFFRVATPLSAISKLRVAFTYWPFPNTL